MNTDADRITALEREVAELRQRVTNAETRALMAEQRAARAEFDLAVRPVKVSRELVRGGVNDMRDIHVRGPVPHVHDLPGTAGDGHTFIPRCLLAGSVDQ